MIRSMTGFGQASAAVAGLRIDVELRSVNHRFADVRMRLPETMTRREAELRRRVLDRVQRGRVEVAVGIGGAAAQGLAFNRELLDEVLQAVGVLQERGLPGQLDVATALTIPGMFRGQCDSVEWADAHHAAVDQALGDALERFDEERRREGRHIQQDLIERFAAMRATLGELEARAAGLPARSRERLVERLRALAADVTLDPARVAQEAALLAERGDVTEEIVRLAGHLDQARQLVAEPDTAPIGKRLDFLLQEIHRETNTINSKAGDLEISRAALALKVEAEKVREQAQNIE
jgi:uncharacterized protein (TIGR00255 family)